MERNLNKAIAVGAAWMMGLRLSYRLIGFVSTAILARLLSPEDFGVVAIAMSFFALIDIFSKLGFQTVLIQNQDSSIDHYNSAWTFNLLFGLLSAVLLVAISGSIATFYQNQNIEMVLWVVSLLFILNGIKNVGVVDFQKELTFDKEFKLVIIPKFISFFVTISIALYCLNFWALVAGNVIWKLLEVIASYKMHSFRPKICFKRGKELFGFSKWLMVNNVFYYLNLRSPELILGKMISPQAAAIYNLSFEIGTMSTSEVISNLNRAIYPGYAKVSSQLSELQSLYKNSIRAIAVIAMPLGAGVALVSPWLVPLFLGDQWLDAIVPVSYLALGGAVNALGSNVSYIYYALGRPRISTFELGFKALVFVTSIYFLVNDNGVVGAAQSFLLTNLVSLVVSCLVLRIVLKISIFEQLWLYAKPFFASLLMSGVVALMMIVFPLSGFLGLLSYAMAGAAIYVFTLYLVWAFNGKPDGIEAKVFNYIFVKVGVLIRGDTSGRQDI